MNLGPIKPDEMKLVATWKSQGTRHRLVRIGDDRHVLERCDRDVPGLEIWTTIYDTKDHPTVRDGGAYSRTVRTLISGIESLAGERAALSRTFDYSTGEGT